MAFTLAPFLSMPIWCGIPAISPLEMFQENILELSYFSITGLQVASTSVFGMELISFIASLEGVWSDAESGLYAVTTFPSMHVAWAVLIVYFGYKLSKKFLIPLIVWFFILNVSTVYTLQHYVVDILAGIFIGVLSIYIVNRLVLWERVRINENNLYLYFFNALSRDVLFLKSSVKTIIK